MGGQPALLSCSYKNHQQKERLIIMDERLFHIVLTILPVLGAVITYLVVPYLKANISAERLAQYKEWAALAVKCAEMVFTEKGMGSDKKAYVVDFLNKLFNRNKTVITEQQLNILVESAVHELNRNKEA